MKEIKRFHEGGYGTTEMKLSDYGDWVLYDDHAEIFFAKNALIAELERGAVGGALMEREMHHSEVMGRMMQEINALQEQVRELAAESARCKFEISRCHQTVDEMFKNREKWIDKEWLSSIWSTSKRLMDETPATDAVLREIRAQAVDDFGIYHNFSDKQLIQAAAKKYAAAILSGEQP